MASNVVVIDASARRATVKTTPGKILSDILQEACSKLGVDASRYGLKYNNKNLDLSNPIRLSGLSPGAKLELVMLSRSPSVVSVALQLPESEAHGAPSARLFERFPSSTTLWLVLRKFETMAPQRNYTARGKTKSETGNSGAGRLYHEAPMLSIMGRDLISFKDLQKTLAQLGYNSGSVLLRLSFRVSETPLEEAMEQTQQYFNSVQSDERAGAHATSITTSEAVPDTVEPIFPEADSNAKPPPETMSPHPNGTIPTDTSDTQRENIRTTSEEPPPPAITGPDQRPITVFKPSSSSTPRAAQQTFNEKDYEPTIAHAKLHQARLQNSGRNKTLLSDKELAEKETAKAQKVADIKEIAIKIRYPDQSTVNAKFTNLDTARTLYGFARGVLASEEEPFLLSFISAKGPRAIPRDSTQRLISDLGMSGSTLVNFLWDEGASPESRTRPVLKEAMLAQAKEIEVPDIPESEAPEEPVHDTGSGKRKENGKTEGKGGMPKWLRGLAKK
ncbi:MAG: hypothetical protein Q9201_003884 [Fulgogasparrea decipioides]